MCVCTHAMHTIHAKINFYTPFQIAIQSFEKTRETRFCTLRCPRRCCGETNLCGGALTLQSRFDHTKIVQFTQALEALHGGLWGKSWWANPFLTSQGAHDPGNIYKMRKVHFLVHKAREVVLLLGYSYYAVLQTVVVIV